jgi:phenylpropionate dioxygenase-like ring-hydroxylating dioxygenase large terminal subunit
MVFLRNCWQVAAFPAELVRGRLLRRQLLGEWVVLYRRADGTPVALEDRCPHRSAPLSRGTLAGDTLRCAYHGLEFGTDGRCTAVPGQSLVPPKARARVHAVLERYGLVWIWMGESAADPALVPDVHWMDDPAWVPATGYHLVRANYQLLTDNLLDLSHETYVHQKTIGNEAVAAEPVETRHDADAVYVRKEIDRCGPPPFYQYLARLPATASVRRWQRTVYRPPGYVVIDVGVEPLDGVPGSNSVEGRVINLITPASATTAHYFWAFARNFRIDEPAVTAFIRANVGRTFDEDQEILELQQANLGDEERDPLYRVAIGADAGVMAARRMLHARIADERAVGVSTTAGSTAAGSTAA